MTNYLFVCSFNWARSPTAEYVARLFGYRADSAGTVFNHAVRPLTRESIERAERIVCMEEEHRVAVVRMVPKSHSRVEVWNIPDNYIYNDPELVRIIEHRLSAEALTKDARRG